MNNVIDDKELTLAREHPRGTERRRLLPYRAALNDVATYAALPEGDRDAIVRWAETRRRIKSEFAVDRDAANLADPLRQRTFAHTCSRANARSPELRTSSIPAATS